MKKKAIYIISLLSMMVTGCMNNNSNNSSSLISNRNSSSSILDSTSSHTSSTISTGNHSSSTATNSSNIDEVSSVNVTGYQNTLEFLHDFDTTSIQVKVNFTDKSEKIYYGKDLSFSFDNFSNAIIGNQKITVSINELELSEDIDVEVIPAKEFSVLMIGNSFSDDTIQWVNEICDSLEVEVTIANLYIGGCILETHYKNLMEEKNAYEFRTYDKTTKRWNTQTSTSIETAIKSYDWEYVSLQQGSSLSGVESSYSYIDSIIELVYDLKEDVKFVWNMTWAYQQDSGHGNFGNYANSQSIMYQSIVNSVQSQVVGNEEFRTIIPNGTAVQNARTSFIGDNLCRDVYCHLTNDFGRYIAGLSLVRAMTGNDITNIAYAPVGVDETYKKIAIESVNNAINKPFEVTKSVYDKEPIVDLSNHVKIDYDSVGCAYYQSDINGYSKLMTNVNISMNYLATETFTKDEIPVGSIIYIDNGYQYRPEGWVNDAPQTTARPGNVKTKYVTVDEKWWGDYTVRGFNISATSGSLMGKMKDAKNAFKIYVPKNAVATQDSLPKIDDTELFKSKSLDIKNYTNYEYMFQNGFYNSSAYDNQQIDYVGSFASKFICTETFTKDTLPVGSILVVDSGYQYRPDAWIGTAINNNRPSNVTTNFVVIDEAWWGDYTIKGFNISRTDGTLINQIPYEAASHFRVYIPTSN